MLHNPNFYIAVMAAAGIALVVTGFVQNRKSNFDDGSFIVQIICILGGGSLCALALVWKLLLSLAS